MIKVHAVSTKGLDPLAVDIEITSTSGIPQIFLIGMANTAVKESKDRIITALKTLGIKLKARKTIISLTPADVKKSGSSFDLAIAVAVLALYQKIRVPLEKTAFIGEVSIDGSIHSVSSCFALVTAAKKLGYQSIIIPHHNLKDLVLINGIAVYGIHHLNELIDKPLSSLKIYTTPSVVEPPQRDLIISGQTEAIRAITIAIAGKHHLHLVGPPGVGKSTLPRFAQAIQPTLTHQQAITVSSLYSLCSDNRSHILQPTFRRPHHTSTLKRILGYDARIIPGEASLAHCGILLMDELPLFNTSVLQALRSLLDQRKVVLRSQEQSSSLPANFILIAASNPCPCGFWQTGIKTCSCTAATRNAYLKKLSWPLLERFDLQTHIQPLQPDEYDSEAPVCHTADIKDEIVTARAFQQTRYGSADVTNASLKLTTIAKFCKLEKETEQFVNKAVATYNLSTRGYEKIIAVSQTIADLEGSPTIKVRHYAEALQYRPAPL